MITFATCQVHLQLSSPEAADRRALSIHRNIECFGLEGTFRGRLAQLPCSKQGHLQLDQVAQSPVQPGLECFQGWDLHCLCVCTASSFLFSLMVELPVQKQGFPTGSPSCDGGGLEGTAGSW